MLYYVVSLFVIKGAIRKIEGMALRTITISRQYGSGGRAIGQAVAERLGIAYYDKEILLQLAEETGYTVDYLERQGEYNTNSALNFAPLSSLSAMRMEPAIALPASVVERQNELIVKLSKEGPCVIVGRAADYLLRERDDVLNLFIYSDEEARIERVAKLYDKVSKEEALRIIKSRDRQRRRHYRFYTDRSWGLPELYHLCINTGKIPYEQAVDMLTTLYNQLNCK